MLHTKSESDITSLAPSSPSRSPKRPVYFVQSPSRDSHDGDKCASMQPTPSFNSPMESPSHPSFGRYSRNSSASRFSGIFRSSSGIKGSRKINDKGWPECNVILEEGKYDEIDDDKAFTRRCQALMALCGFIVLFIVFCLVIWGAARPYRAEVSIKSLSVHNFYVGSGADSTGVPTKMLNVNATLRMFIYNPATFFGIHVSSTPVNLIYSDIVVATGQVNKYYQTRKSRRTVLVDIEGTKVNKYYQTRKSRRTVLVDIEGTKVPLYGAGSSLEAAKDGSVEIPLKLEFEIRSQGAVVGKLVRTKHRKRISCSLVIDSKGTKPIKFKKDLCVYN